MEKLNYKKSKKWKRRIIKRAKNGKGELFELQKRFFKMITQI